MSKPWLKEGFIDKNLALCHRTLIQNMPNSRFLVVIIDMNYQRQSFGMNYELFKIYIFIERFRHVNCRLFWQG